MIRTDAINKRHRGLWLAVAIMLALLAWLAIHWPHGSLWYDESLTTYVATDSWQTLINWCTQVDIQVPFHYIVLRGLTAIAGDSEFSLHLLSALSVLMAVAGMMSVGRQIAQSKRVGYVAAILLGAMPGILWLGYEVRAYALGLALYAWATAFLCAILNPAKNPLVGKRRWLIVIYVLLMLATLYTHYTALAGFAAHLASIGLLAILRRSRPLFGALAAIVILVGLGFAPWLPTMLTRGAADRSYYIGGPIPPDRAISVMLGFKLLGREDSPADALPLMLGY